MAKVALLGVGLQGKAVLYDLEQSSIVDQIIAADRDKVFLEEFLKEKGYKKVLPAEIDASSVDSIDSFLEEFKPDLVVCMLPPALAPDVAKSAVDRGIHYVSSNYTGELVSLDSDAKRNNVTVLPEMGMDPGIDLLLARLAIGELDVVEGLYSYGGGLPAPECADSNPLKYKITWTFEGVLKAYKRPAKLLKNGREVVVPEGEIFRENNVHILEVPGFGKLEAYPNGDAVQYIEKFGLDESSVKDMGRFALRWPGHCDIWNMFLDLGFLSEEAVEVKGCKVSPFDFMVAHLTPRLEFDSGERDAGIIVVSAWGKKNNRACWLSYYFIDYRDLETGFFAMNRMVGFTSSIAAQLVLNGSILKRGVLSPARDIEPMVVLDELKKRGMKFEKTFAWCN